MKRLVMAAMVFFFIGGLAIAKDFEVTKKAGDYTVVVTIDKNPPTTGDNNLIRFGKGRRWRRCHGCQGFRRVFHAGHARDAADEVQHQCGIGGKAV